MSLKSSEVKNFLSSWINKILKAFLVSSVFCHCTLPLFIRSMLRLLKFVSKTIFLSPEFSRSIFFSWKLTMTKKSSQSFWHWESESRTSSWLNIRPKSLTDRYSSCSWQIRSSIGSTCKSNYIRFQRIISEVSCSLSSYSLSIKSVTNLFNPWEILTHEWDLSLFTDSFLISLHICLASSWLWLLTRAQFGVPSNPTFRVRWFFISWQSALTTCHWFCKLSELFSILLSWSTVRLQLLSRFLHQCKFWSQGFGPRVFPLVLGTFTIDLLVQERQSKV